jgi:hypothetical protein
MNVLKQVLYIDSHTYPVRGGFDVLSLIYNVSTFVNEGGGLFVFQHAQETMGTAYLVNAPVLFSAVWSVAKVFVDRSTEEKVGIVGQLDKNTKQKQIALDEIGAEIVPQWLGGGATHTFHDCPPWHLEGPLKAHLERGRRRGEN